MSPLTCAIAVGAQLREEVPGLPGEDGDDREGVSRKYRMSEWWRFRSVQSMLLHFSDLTFFDTFFLYVMAML
jgi:anti-anti-sigma regulatory factor